MTSKHTPGRLSRNIPPVSKYPILFAGRNTHVAQIITRGISPEEAEANADYMCFAWNEFPAMLEALREINETIAERMCLIETGELDATETLAGIQNNARAILARIDGESND